MCINKSIACELKINCQMADLKASTCIYKQSFVLLRCVNPAALKGPYTTGTMLDVWYISNVEWTVSGNEVNRIPWALRQWSELADWLIRYHVKNSRSGDLNFATHYTTAPTACRILHTVNESHYSPEPQHMPPHFKAPESINQDTVHSVLESLICDTVTCPCFLSDLCTFPTAPSSVGRASSSATCRPSPAQRRNWTCRWAACRRWRSVNSSKVNSTGQTRGPDSCCPRIRTDVKFDWSGFRSIIK